MNLHTVLTKIHQDKFRMSNSLFDSLNTVRGKCAMKDWIFAKDTTNIESAYSPGGEEWGWYCGDLKITPVIIDCSSEGQKDGCALEFEDEDGNKLRINSLEEFIRILKGKMKEIKEAFPDVDPL